MQSNRTPKHKPHPNLRLRAEVETFLYSEAELLDEWKLEEWVELFTEDGVSQVPPLNDSTLTPESSLFVVADDMSTLRSRVRQLLGGTAWAEVPRSKLRRIITNVRVVESGRNGVRVRANFHVHKTRRGQVANFIGEYHYLLVRHGDSFRIAERVVFLTQDEFNQGALSFII